MLLLLWLLLLLLLSQLRPDVVGAVEESLQVPLRPVLHLHLNLLVLLAVVVGAHSVVGGHLATFAS